MKKIFLMTMLIISLCGCTITVNNNPPPDPIFVEEVDLMFPKNCEEVIE